MLLYRGDKLQVSLLALVEHFRQTARALTDCCTWPHTIPEISRRHRAVAKFHQWRQAAAPKAPPISPPPLFFCKDDDSLKSMCGHPFFFLPLSSCNDMMNDVVSPSRRSTHKSSNIRFKHSPTVMEAIFPLILPYCGSSVPLILCLLFISDET